jgi:hypothetical protein
MLRRKFVLGAAAAALGTNAGRAYADAQCTPFNQFGVQTCSASVSIRSAVTTFQEQTLPQWCWAACLSVIFNYWGHRVSQQTIVRSFYGGIVNMPGSNEQIMAGLNGNWVDDDGRRFSVQGDTYGTNPMTAANDLATGMPLIVCTQGHAMVLTNLTCNRNFSGQIQVTDAGVMDPWPGNGFRSLSPQEWYNIYLCARVRVYG